MNTYGMGNGFTWQPKTGSSNATSWSKWLNNGSDQAVKNAHDMFSMNQGMAFQWGLQGREHAHQDAMQRRALESAEKQARDARKAQQGSGVGKAMQLIGSVGSLIPGGKIAGTALAGIGGMIG